MHTLKTFVQKNLSENGKTFTVTVCAVLLALLLLIHLGLQALPRSLTALDASVGKMYTLSEETKRGLTDVDTDIYLYAVMDAGAEDVQMMTFLSRFAAANKRIHVASLDKVKHADFLAEKGAADATSGSVLVETPYRSLVVDYASLIMACNETLGLTVPYTEYANSSGEYGGPYFYNASVGLLTAMQYAYYGAYYEQNGIVFEQVPMDLGFAAEQEVMNAIYYCLVEKPATIYVYSAHGASPLSETLSSVLTRALMEVKTWNQTGELHVPADCDMLLLLTPTEDLSPAEINELYGWIEAGGHAVLTTSFEHICTQTNLTTMLATAGIRPDTERLSFVVENDAGHVYSPYYPYIIVAENGESDLLTGVADNRVMLTMAGALTLDEGADVAPLYLTSATAYEYYPNDLDAEGKPTVGPAGVQTVGAVSNIGKGALVYVNANGVFDEQVINVNAGNFYHLAMLCNNMAEVPTPKTVTVAPAVTASALNVPLVTMLILAAVFCVALPLCVLTVGLIRIGRRKRA